MHSQKSAYQNNFFGEERLARYFLKFFKTRKKSQVRPGALHPDELREMIKKIGKDKKVNIVRVQYDGTPEENPVSVKIVNIQEDYFTGVIVNVERSIKQEMDDKLIYVKGGGGSVDFYYNDGDIMSVEEDFDETIIQEMDEEQVLEILDALDLNESVRISYYDKGKGGVINGMGRLISKEVADKTFVMELSLINDIELDDPKKVTLNLDQTPVFALEVLI
jgi:hypothetical protein